MLRSKHTIISASAGLLGKVKLLLLSQFRNYRYLHLMVILYIAFFSINVIMRHYTFASSAWDLGIFNQALYTTVKQGKLFYYTAELYANPGGTIFGVHFSPILFLIIPFYIVLPRPETLLIIQTVVLASGAYPTFLLAKDVLRNKSMSLSFSLLYLMYPHLHGINLFDFHPDAFFVPFALFSLYYFTKQEWSRYFLFLLLSFLTKEFASLPFLVLGLVDAWSMRERIVASIKKRSFHDRRIFIPIMTITMTVLWYLVANAFIHFFNPSPPSRFVQGSPWYILGRNPLDLSFLGSITTLNFAGALKFQFDLKLFYLFTILGPLAFLPVMKRSLFLPVLPWLLLAFLSNYPPYYQLGHHYSAFIVPFSIAAAIYGLDSLGLSFNLDEKTLFKLLKKVVLVGFLFALAVTILTLPITKMDVLLISEHDKNVYKALEIIPPEASVLSQYDIFPHLSSRVNSFVVPPPFAAFKRDYYYYYVNSLFNKGLEFVLIDVNPDVKTHALRVTYWAVFNEVARNRNYGLYASIDGVLVFKYGYQGEPTLYKPFAILYSLQEHGYSTVVDRNKIIFEYPLPTGNYTVTYRMKVDPKVEGLLFTIKVHQDTEVLAFKDVYGEEFSAANTYQNFTLPFSILDLTKEVKFSIANLSIRTSVDLESIEITQIHYSIN